MVIIVAEDGMVKVVETVEEAERYESIDVENNVFVFYDEQGRWLRPRFIAPNRYRFFGFILDQGTFVLEPSVELDPAIDPLPLALAEARYLEPNQYFKDLTVLREHYGSPILPLQFE